MTGLSLGSKRLSDDLFVAVFYLLALRNRLGELLVLTVVSRACK